MSETVIEDVIRAQLTGDAQKNALDFVAFLRENKLQLTSNSDGSGWAVGGVEGDSAGYMIINGAPQFPGPWTVWLNSCDFGENPVDDDVKECVWAHASPCGKCHKNWEDCGGRERTIWGRKFERLCHSPLMFINPDAGTLTHLKKLMLTL